MTSQTELERATERVWLLSECQRLRAWLTVPAEDDEHGNDYIVEVEMICLM